MRAVAAVLLCLVWSMASAKMVALGQILDDGRVVYLPSVDIDFVGPELGPFKEMSDCKIFFRWDAEGKYPYLIDSDGARVVNHGVLSCIGVEGAVHNKTIQFLV